MDDIVIFGKSQLSFNMAFISHHIEQYDKCEFNINHLEHAIDS